MDSIFQRMLALAREAQREGIPPEQVVFGMNKAGLRRYMRELEAIPSLRALTGPIKIEYRAQQPSEVILQR